MLDQSLVQTNRLTLSEIQLAFNNNQPMTPEAWQAAFKVHFPYRQIPESTTPDRYQLLFIAICNTTYREYPKFIAMLFIAAKANNKVYLDKLADNVKQSMQESLQKLKSNMSNEEITEAYRQNLFLARSVNLSQEKINGINKTFFCIAKDAGYMEWLQHYTDLCRMLDQHIRDTIKSKLPRATRSPRNALANLNNMQDILGQNLMEKLNWEMDTNFGFNLRTVSVQLSCYDKHAEQKKIRCAILKRLSGNALQSIFESDRIDLLNEWRQVNRDNPLFNEQLTSQIMEALQHDKDHFIEALLNLNFDLMPCIDMACIELIIQKNKDSIFYQLLTKFPELVNKDFTNGTGSHKVKLFMILVSKKAKNEYLEFVVKNHPELLNEIFYNKTKDSSTHFLKTICSAAAAKICLEAGSDPAFERPAIKGYRPAMVQSIDMDDLYSIQTYLSYTRKPLKLANLTVAPHASLLSFVALHKKKTIIKFAIFKCIHENYMNLKQCPPLPLAADDPVLNELSSEAILEILCKTNNEFIAHYLTKEYPQTLSNENVIPFFTKKISSLCKHPSGFIFTTDCPDSLWDAFQERLFLNDYQDLMIAIDSGNTALFKKMQDAFKATPNILQTPRENNFLNYALQKNQVDIAEMLNENGASISAAEINKLRKTKLLPATRQLLNRISPPPVVVSEPVIKQPTKIAVLTIDTQSWMDFIYKAFKYCDNLNIIQEGNDFIISFSGPKNSPTRTEMNLNSQDIYEQLIPRIQNFLSNNGDQLGVLSEKNGEMRLKALQKHLFLSVQFHERLQRFLQKKYGMPSQERDALPVIPSSIPPIDPPVPTVTDIAIRIETLYLDAFETILCKDFPSISLLKNITSALGYEKADEIKWSIPLERLLVLKANNGQFYYLEEVLDGLCKAICEQFGATSIRKEKTGNVVSLFIQTSVVPLALFESHIPTLAPFKLMSPISNPDSAVALTPKKTSITQRHRLFTRKSFSDDYEKLLTTLQAIPSDYKTLIRSKVDFTNTLSKQGFDPFTENLLYLMASINILETVRISRNKSAKSFIKNLRDAIRHLCMEPNFVITSVLPILTIISELASTEPTSFALHIQKIEYKEKYNELQQLINPLFKLLEDRDSQKQNWFTLQQFVPDWIGRMKKYFYSDHPLKHFAVLAYICMISECNPTEQISCLPIPFQQVTRSIYRAMGHNIAENHETLCKQQFDLLEQFIKMNPTIWEGLSSKDNPTQHVSVNGSPRP